MTTYTHPHRFRRYTGPAVDLLAPETTAAIRPRLINAIAEARDLTVYMTAADWRTLRTKVANYDCMLHASMVASVLLARFMAADPEAQQGVMKEAMIMTDKLWSGL